jgi:predicted nucleic acid-binding Zn ribbon protein
LGELRHVEVVIGAGVQDGGNQQGERRGLARFFAVFSTDNVTTYSCNCAATGIQKTIVGGTTEDSTTCPIDSRRIQVQIVSLSCAKDEGLGRTFDLIQERKRTS